MLILRSAKCNWANAWTLRQDVSPLFLSFFFQLPHGEYHRIHTIGSKPSCYMFVYENTTDKAEYKKEMLTKRQFQRMVNASKEEPGKLGMLNAELLRATKQTNSLIVLSS